ncbi:unnamed protein product [Angiostrongylus costaricensis]|uniref:Secreted protein n=1 Tax=Angiostrongylus costaricensis TaxID=334426 RepID=A0A0R3PN19_ANGCS|nr:unnamed protein product [Angiostrongylus costaricensis]
MVVVEMAMERAFTGVVLVAVPAMVGLRTAVHRGDGRARHRRRRRLAEVVERSRLGQLRHGNSSPAAAPSTAGHSSIDRPAHFPPHSGRRGGGREWPPRPIMCLALDEAQYPTA